jgi:hypothetical protein
MLDVVLPVTGALLVLVASWDILVSTLSAVAHGPVTRRLTRLAWRIARALDRLVGRRGLRVAGPLALAVSFTYWVNSFWVGFGLIYLPHLDAFRFSREAPFADLDLAEALYISATSLTTVGFGDVVGATDVLRLLTTLEAASGLAIITASITYLLSVQTPIVQLRAGALRASDSGLEEPRTVAELGRHRAFDAVSALQSDLVRVQEELRRFPILFYADAGRREESLSTLLRAATLVCLVLGWGGGWEAAPRASALRRTLERIFDDLERSFLGGADGAATPGAADVRARWKALHRATGDPPRGDEPPEDFARFLRRADAFLARLADVHRHDVRPLLAPGPEELREQDPALAR